MSIFQRRLRRCGYQVYAYSYPSVRLTLTQNAQRLARYCKALDCAKIHFAAHSLGGLVALQTAKLMQPDLRGRIVVIGTPFAESVAGRSLVRFPGGRSLLGRCMGQWLQTPRGEALQGLEIGVIAGNGGKGMGRVIAPRLPKPHDGVVSVDETRVPGMRDHIVLSVSHTAMLLSRDVVRQTCAFLHDGTFERSKQSLSSST